jgi:hypothetical protein
MPSATDYSKTYVYEIVCKDASVKDKYLGYTTNFTQRKYNHKRFYQHKETEMYDVMAKNGGFDNWYIRVLAKYKCQDANEARMMLQKHPGYILENIKQELFKCDVCDYQCDIKSNFRVHCKTAKHLANILPTKMELVPTPTPTPNLENLVVELIKQNLEQQKQNLEQQKQNQEQKDQMTELIKSNQQLQTQMIEICKRPTTQNNTVNLQFFLNETCKNAMTLDDFVEQLVITEEETLRQASTPYIDGFAAILEDRLCDKLEIHERPVHYTDAKRKVAYYKDRKQNGWIKNVNNMLENDLCHAIMKKMSMVAVINQSKFGYDICDKIFQNVVPNSSNNELQHSKVLQHIILRLAAKE